MKRRYLRLPLVVRMIVRFLQLMVHRHPSRVVFVMLMVPLMVVQNPRQLVDWKTQMMVVMVQALMFQFVPMMRSVAVMMVVMVDVMVLPDPKHLPTMPDHLQLQKVMVLLLS